MSLSKSRIKFIKSLQIKKFRQRYNKFVLEGDKMARELLRSPDQVIDSIYALPRWIDAVNGHLPLPGEKLFVITENELSRISGMKSPNQVLIVAELPQQTWLETEVRKGISLYLDDIQDPGNLGAILRVADWFGLTHVFCSPNCVDLFNPKVIQSAMGAFLRVRSPVITLFGLRQYFPDLPIIGADMEGENLFQAPVIQTGLIVIGNEGGGISPQARHLLQRTVSIPRAANSQAESLNAAVAAGIICAVLKNHPF